jgi:hypothetical protein
VCHHPRDRERRRGPAGFQDDKSVSGEHCSLRTSFAEGVHAYGGTLSKVMAAMNARRGTYSSATLVAETIFTAAIDGTDRVMYVAGPDAEQAFTLLHSLSEAERLEMVRQLSGL